MLLSQNSSPEALYKAHLNSQHKTQSRMENYPEYRFVELTYESRHVPRRLSIKIWFTDYCCLCQAIATRIISQNLIICRF